MRKNYRRTSTTKKNTGLREHGIKPDDKKVQQPTETQRTEGDASKKPSPSLLDAHDSILTVKDLSEMLQVDEPAIRWQIREKRIPAHDYYGRKLSLQSEVMWTIRNSKCNMDMSDMYGKREWEEEDDTEESA